MNDEEADEQVRAALSEAFPGYLVGDFLALALIYDEEGLPQLAFHISSTLDLRTQIGWLTSALNRCNKIDADGWEERGDDA